jgi:hypothetical protein
MVTPSISILRLRGRVGNLRRLLRLALLRPLKRQLHRVGRRILLEARPGGIGHGDLLVGQGLLAGCGHLRQFALLRRFPLGFALRERAFGLGLRRFLLRLALGIELLHRRRLRREVDGPKRHVRRKLAGEPQLRAQLFALVLLGQGQLTLPRFHVHQPTRPIGRVPLPLVLDSRSTNAT